MSQTEPSNRIRAGFIPLVDSAVLIAAVELGFALAEGIQLELTRENSWANIRDKVAFGALDCAHMLAPMPLAMSFGLGRSVCPAIAPFVLSANGNAITASLSLAAEMRDAAEVWTPGDPTACGRALATVIQRRKQAGKAMLSIAIPYPFSCHDYVLRHWLTHSGIQLWPDVRIVVVPPPLMADALQSGSIDGFCVGEPWNSVAVDAGVGEIITLTSSIWRFGPEKVLGMRQQWAEKYPEALASLLRALYRASVWADNPANHVTLSEILARPRYLNMPAEVIERALSGKLTINPSGNQLQDPDFLVFHRKATNFPWRSHILWIYAQMVRWGQVEHFVVNERIARGVFRPDLYREVLGPIGADLPGASEKVEGALKQALLVASSRGNLELGPDGFFDGSIFDPAELKTYFNSLGLAV